MFNDEEECKSEENEFEEMEQNESESSAGRDELTELDEFDWRNEFFLAMFLKYVWSTLKK